MQPWNVRVGDEGRIDAGHKHGLGYARAEKLTDESGNVWAKCTRCGASTVIERQHPDARMRRD